MTAFCKRLYDEFFYVPKHSKGRIREKVLFTRVTLSVLLMVLCMSAMSLTAYAFFTHTLYSGVTTVQSASWSIEIDAPQGLTPTPDGAYALNNSTSDSEAVYTFTLRRASAATATVGYTEILITTDAATAPQPFYTLPMGRFLQGDVMVEDNDRVVSIAVPAGRQATVSFVGQWGTCTREPIVDESQPLLPRFAAATADTTTQTTTTTTTADTTTTTAATTTTTADTTTTTEAPTTTTLVEDTTGTTLPEAE